MERTRKNRMWMVVGVVVAIVLLLYWLFAGTILEQEANSETDPMTIEQNI